MPDSAERREEIRIPLNILMKFNILNSRNDYMRAPAPGSNISMTSNSNSQTLNQNNPLEAFLIQLDKKINILLELMNEKARGKHYQYQAEALEISESGLRIDFPEKIPDNAFLEIGLTLPGASYRLMDIAVQALWRGTREDREARKIRNVFGLAFYDVLPEDRDEIVHYIFRKQRENIRTLREKAE